MIPGRVLMCTRPFYLPAGVFICLPGYGIANNDFQTMANAIEITLQVVVDDRSDSSSLSNYQ